MAKQNLPEREDNIGAVVRRARKEARLTQPQLAALADVGTRFVHDLESGKRTVRLDVTEKVLDVLGMRLTAIPLAPRGLRASASTTSEAP